MSDIKENMSYVELDEKDLPAYCPNPAMPIWSTHPRVYLDLGDHGTGKCPYCGTVYKLKPGAIAKGRHH
ncbi:zinc-finger domain-containing protein [Oxalobacteraceae bacterium OM1]|nr:zinc-finger domain-containing protein [Oxalobacteraceae bacterium OM1]